MVREFEGAGGRICRYRTGPSRAQDGTAKGGQQADLQISYKALLYKNKNSTILASASENAAGLVRAQ